MNRRDLLRNLGFGAVALMPVGVAAAEETKKSEAIGPVLMERVCDGGEAECDPKDWAEIMAIRKEQGLQNCWCGTRFQWYWGSGCCCPKCDMLYCITRESKEKYIVKS